MPTSEVCANGHTHPFDCSMECGNTTFDIFFNEDKEQWGVRELASGDVKRITFHRDLLYLLSAFEGLSLGIKVGPAVSAWSCTMGKCRCYRA